VRSRVLLIILDGCRPDAIEKAETPHLDSLWREGAFTWSARTVMPCVTLPAHVSMFRGVSPQRHGVADNTHQPSASAFPSILELTHAAGLHTAMFYSWGPLRDLAAPGKLRMGHCREAVYGQDNDSGVARAAAAYLVEERPDFAVLYFGDVDITGHLHGWMSPAYLQALERNDRALGEVLRALESAGLREGTTFLVVSDHGGHDHVHGSDVPDDMTIPFILSGAGVKRGHRIAAPVDVRDVASTLAHLLGVEPAPCWEGRPVVDALLAPA
jgi:predicted AlkP superfamily pyrophosphatase or phosphodiesterase